MATVKVTIGSGVAKSINNKVKKKLETKKVLSEVNKQVQSALRENRYSPLALKTIKRRKRLATVNSTDPKYSSGRSNLTFTGEFIKSITARFTKGFGLNIKPRGKHRGYKLINGGRSKSVNNADIARGQADQGRDIVTNLQDNIVKRIVKIFNKVLK